MRDGRVRGEHLNDETRRTEVVAEMLGGALADPAATASAPSARGALAVEATARF